MIYAGLMLSLVINVLLVLYIRFILQKLFFFSETQEMLKKKFTEFTDHLRKLRQRPLFFQDAEFQNLFLHAREIEEVIEEYFQFVEFLPEGTPSEEDSEENQYEEFKRLRKEEDDKLPFEPEVLGFVKK